MFNVHMRMISRLDSNSLLLLNDGAYDLNEYSIVANINDSEMYLK